MIDWLTMRAVPFTHDRQLFSGRVMCISPEGEIEWQSDRWLGVVGSHDARVMVRTNPEHMGRCIDVSGNPAKFLQGHNVFGSDDVCGLAVEMLRKLSAHLQTRPLISDLAAWSGGRVSLTRVDINYSFSMGTRGRARQALRSLEQHGFLSHRGRGNLTKGGTLYYGKTSRRWALKVYCKGDEIDAPKHGLPETIPDLDALRAWASDKLRVEIVLRGMHLKEASLDTLGAWNDTMVSRVFQLHLARLKVSDAVIVSPAVLESLPPRLQAAYQLWRDGHDLRELFSRATFYRYRTGLAKVGIDVAVKQYRDPARDVVPLQVVLHGHHAPVPDWARGTSLYFERPKLKRVA